VSGIYLKILILSRLVSLLFFIS